MSAPQLFSHPVIARAIANRVRPGDLVQRETTKQWAQVIEVVRLDEIGQLPELYVDVIEAFDEPEAIVDRAWWYTGHLIHHIARNRS